MKLKIAKYLPSRMQMPEFSCLQALSLVFFMAFCLPASISGHTMVQTYTQGHTMTVNQSYADPSTISTCAGSMAIATPDRMRIIGANVAAEMVSQGSTFCKNQTENLIFRTHNPFNI